MSQKKVTTKRSRKGKGAADVTPAPLGETGDDETPTPDYRFALRYESLGGDEGGDAAGELAARAILAATHAQALFSLLTYVKPKAFNSDVFNVYTLDDALVYVGEIGAALCGVFFDCVTDLDDARRKGGAE